MIAYLRSYHKTGIIKTPAVLVRFKFITYIIAFCARH